MNTTVEITKMQGKYVPIIRHGLMLESVSCRSFDTVLECVEVLQRMITAKMLPADTKIIQEV